MKAHILPSLENLPRGRCFSFYDDLILVVENKHLHAYVLPILRILSSLTQVLIVKVGGQLHFVGPRQTQGTEM